MQGKLICLYGIDGSGKSTILEMLNNSKLKNTVCTSCLKKAIFEEELYQAEKNLHFHRQDVFSHEFKHVLHIGSVIYRMYNEYLNVDIDTAFARIQQRSLKTGVPPHYSESKQALILKQTKYEEIIPSESYPVIKVNANQDINMVYSTVLKLLKQLEIC